MRVLEGDNQYRTRRTFAIISHPDAGKTTLTEKLLLASGAIHLAGQVKARGNRRRARSDWMAIEQERGISVTSSVMTFESGGIQHNLLDTPGHSDFSEDTYRTLTAVDSAIMVLDAAKGIEAQTRKLFEVCRLRNIPILTFINKIDREGREPISLLDEIEETLALECTPLNWPIGMGYDLAGVELLTDWPSPAGTGANESISWRSEILPATGDRRLAEEIQLVQAAYRPLDLSLYREGSQTPVIFGSALKDLGVDLVLRFLVDHSPLPSAQTTALGDISPDEPKVSGFVFKIQANMDPLHRDRVAFFRVCSGVFRRGMKLVHSRSKRSIAINNPIFFFAQDRVLAEEAHPGDVVGIPNHGTLRVGDSLSETGAIRFQGIPNFAPELFRRIRLDDPMRMKQMRRAALDLSEEGVVQVFQPLTGGTMILGVVGGLQFDVLRSRLASEYRISVDFEAAPYEAVRWVSAEDHPELEKFVAASRHHIAVDADQALVYLARNTWDLNRTISDWPALSFTAVRERST